MTTSTVRRIALLTLITVPACGGGDGGVNGPPAGPVVTTIEISPNPVTVFMGDTIQLTATVKDQNGSPMAGKKVTWASDVATVATIDSLGRLVARASGTARISATVEGKTGSVTLTSTGPGTTGAVTGSATIGTTGGSVQATLPGGGTMNLTVPSGALRTSVSITLEPLVPPPGALASFHLTPAGVQFDKNATLVIKLSPGARLRPTSTLVFEQAGQRIPVAGAPNLADGTLTISLSALGLSENPAAGVSSRTRALQSHGAAGSATGSVYNLALDMLYLDVQVALDQLTASGTIAYAENAQRAWEALTGQGVAQAKADSRYVAFRNHWTSSVCGFTNFAFNALANFNFVSDYRGLERVMVAVIHWHRVAKEMDEHLRVNLGEPVNVCVNGLPDPNTRIHARLTTLEPSIRADLNAFAVEPSPRDSSFFADRLKPLIDLGASLAFLGNPQDAQIVQDIVREQLVRLRSVGYARCRASSGASQEIQGRLARNLVVGPLPGLTLADLQTDIEMCGMRIDWAVLDSVSISIANGTLGGGNFPGQSTTSASATLVGDGQLRFRSGQLQALLCPAPSSANNEQLEIAAGRNAQSLTRVAVVSPSNQNLYLAVSPLLIGTDTLRTVAGLASGDSGTVTVVVRRIGGVCSGLFTLASHSPLATLNLTLEPVGEVLSVGGAVVQIPAPASVVRNGRESNTAIALFRERATSLTNQLNVDISTPGTYSTSLSPGSIAAGTNVITYFLHIDPVGNPGSRFTYQGTVTFSKDILGVISKAVTLDATDGILGAPGTGYPTGDSDRSTPVGPGNTKGDQITLSANRRTLTFTMLSSAMGQIRVVLKK